MGSVASSRAEAEERGKVIVHASAGWAAGRAPSVYGVSGEHSTAPMPSWLGSIRMELAWASMTKPLVSIRRNGPPCERPEYGPWATTSLEDGSTHWNVKYVGVPTSGVGLGRGCMTGTGIWVLLSTCRHRKSVIPLRWSSVSVSLGTKTMEMSSVRSRPPETVSKSMLPRQRISMYRPSSGRELKGCWMPAGISL